MKNRIPVLILLLFFMAMPALAAKKMTIAVLELKSQGVPKIVTRAVSDIVLSEFVNIDNFKVTERAQIDKVLKEQALQMTGITDNTSAIKVGKLLSVQKIIIGEVTSFRKGVLVNLRVVDIETGVSEYSEREKANTLDNADKAASQVARKLAQRIVQKYKRYLTAKEPIVYYTMAILPGLGQIYAEHNIKGYTILGLFALSCAYNIYSFLDFRIKRKAYLDLGIGSTTAEFNKKYKDYKNARNYFAISLGITGFIYLASWVDVLFFSKPDFQGIEMKQANYSGGIFMDAFAEYANHTVNDRTTNFSICMRF